MKRDSARRAIALDSSFLVALRGGDGKDNMQRAMQALETHADDFIVLPAPAYAECLPGEIPPGLSIIDMTAAAAKIASLFKGAIKTRGQDVTKREVSIDLFILATAEAHECAVLYALDGVFAQVAAEHRLRVQVRGLPPRKPIQTEIPLGPRLVPPPEAAQPPAPVRSKKSKS
jgi:predicted nucleic acid-binding protein